MYAATPIGDTMVVYKASAVKLYPSKTQIGYFPEVSGLCNTVYNLCLEQDRKFFSNKSLFTATTTRSVNGEIREVKNARYYGRNKFDQSKELKELKGEFPFFKIAPHSVLQNAIMDYHDAKLKMFRDYAAGRAKKIRLKFRKRDKNRSFEITHDKFKLAITSKNEKNGKILMPNLARYVANKQDEASPLPNGKKRKANPNLGWVKFRGLNLPEEAKITKLVVKEEADGWYGVVFYKQTVPKPIDRTNDDPLGVDRNVDNLCVDSNGSLVESDRFYAKGLPKLKKLQRKIAKQQKTSKRRKKTRSELARAHQKIARKRRDSLHKTTTKIAKSHGVVVLEDLQIKNMTKSNKGTVEEPGKNRAQKRGLNRSILEQGWGIMKQMLAYKLAYSGGILGLVHPAYTSQTCPECFHKSKKNRATRDSFKCVKCGHEAHADHNASVNIRNRWGTASGKQESISFPVERDVLRVAEFS